MRIDKEGGILKRFEYRKKVSLGIIAMFILGSMISLVPASGGNLNAVIYVDDDNTSGPWDGTEEHPYQHIQDAIDNADDGDTIIVKDGIYQENVVVYRSVTLIGQNKTATIIDGGGKGNVVKITDIKVTVKNFTITNSGNTQEMMRKDAGVTICNGSYNVKIQENIISNNRGNGIYADNPNYVTIIGNDITNNAWDGIGFYEKISNPMNEISNNTISNNGIDGVYLFQSFANIYHNNISYNGGYGVHLQRIQGIDIMYNKISNNKRGVNLKINCIDNKIWFNNITYNTEFGLYVQTQSSKNRIFKNNFIGNKKQASFQRDVFYIQYPLRQRQIWYENYWSDWKFNIGRVLNYYFIWGKRFILPWFEVDTDPSHEPYPYEDP